MAPGTTVLRARQVVTPAVLGLAAALGLAGLPVIPRPAGAGDLDRTELVIPGTPLQPGQIYESNSVMLAGAVRDAGADVVAVATAEDDVAQFSAILDQHAAGCRRDHHQRRSQRGRLRGRQGRLRPGTATRQWNSSRWRCSRACRRASAG